MIGERLKHAFGGNTAWILSYRDECFDQIGLKPSLKTPLYNGSLECELRKYAMFEGRMKVFREDGGIVKTEDEKQAMAEMRRFKKTRDFKRRFDEEEENEEGDIRSFTFHSFERDYRGQLRPQQKPRRETTNADTAVTVRESGMTKTTENHSEKMGGREEKAKNDSAVTTVTPANTRNASEETNAGTSIPQETSLDASKTKTKQV